MSEISEYHVRLGNALRRARVAAGLSTRAVPRPGTGGTCFSSAHISLIERGHTAPSPELVEAYRLFADNPGELDALYEQLKAAVERAGRQRRHGKAAAGPAPPTRLTASLGPKDVERHYLVESSDTRYEFTSTGAIAEVSTRVMLRAKAPGVRLCCAAHQYAADRRPGVLRIDKVEGGTLVESRESDVGALQSFFELDRELSPADPEPYPFAFRLSVTSTERAEPRLRFYPDQGNRRLLLQASFPAEARPQRLWWFAGSNPVHAEYPTAANVLSPSADGTYRFGFEDLVSGWCYGFGWSW
jgi:hypothetical protein